MASLYLIATDHGYGHAARSLHLLRTLMESGVIGRATVNTTMPPELVRSIVGGSVGIRNAPIDSGVVQSDAVTMDPAKTLKRLREIQGSAPQLIEREARFVADHRFDLILADIPYLAPAIGRASSVPVVSMGNFGWDFIYRELGAEFTPYADWIRGLYGESELLLRLPFHEEMVAFPRRIDVDLVGGRPAISRAGVIERLNLDVDVPAYLITFGGLGFQSFPFEKVAAFDGKRLPRRSFITYGETHGIPNLIRAPEDLRPVDIMQACEGVITKPGYGILAEALYTDCPVYAIERSGFAETPILERAIREQFRHRFITNAEFFEGGWGFLCEDPLEPEGSVWIERNGNERCVEIIRKMIINRQDMIL